MEKLYRTFVIDLLILENILTLPDYVDVDARICTT